MAGDLRGFLATLESLPPFQGISFRGCTPAAEFVRPGQSVVTRGLVSSSRSLEVATEGGTVQDLYVILGLTGRDIRPFSARRADREIVFPPGALFHLADTLEVGDRRAHLVVELDPQRPELPDVLLAEFRSRARDLFAAATIRTEPDPEQISGKFAGDLA